MMISCYVPCRDNREPIIWQLKKIIGESKVQAVIFTQISVNQSKTKKGNRRWPIYKGQPQLDASARGKGQLACVVVGPGPSTPS